MPKLSIITINFNDNNGLEKTIKSVVSQTFTDFEYIIIDGGSTDGSIDVIKKYSDRINYWISEKDNGIYNAQNKGIANAKGEYCLFLNSGDYLVDKNVLQNVFLKNYHEDILYGDMLIDWGNGNVKHGKMPDNITSIQMLTDTLWHPVSFIKKELFIKYGRYDESYEMVADYEFFVRTIIAKRVSTKHIPIEIVVFDTLGVSSNMSKRTQLIKERKKVQDIYFNPVLLALFRLYSKLRN
jgi:glycosyltransferase involved in cell wall biosynthesis